MKYLGHGCALFVFPSGCRGRYNSCKSYRVRVASQLMWTASRTRIWPLHCSASRPWAFLGFLKNYFTTSNGKPFIWNTYGSYEKVILLGILGLGFSPFSLFRAIHFLRSSTVLHLENCPFIIHVRHFTFDFVVDKAGDVHHLLPIANKIVVTFSISWWCIHPHS